MHLTSDASTKGVSTRCGQSACWHATEPALLNFLGAQSLAGANFTNAVVDRVAFDKSDMSNTNWSNAVITVRLGTSAECSSLMNLGC